ncbi:fyuA [Symbiodinium microadriaticum]|nr:fyuA [Symbiodinium microadriaticum]
MTASDILGMGPIYAILIAIALAIALPTASWASRLISVPRPLVYAAAGGVAMLTMLVLMEQVFFGLPLISGARTTSGLLAQTAAGIIAGWLYLDKRLCSRAAFFSFFFAITFAMSAPLAMAQDAEDDSLDFLEEDSGDDFLAEDDLFEDEEVEAQEDAAAEEELAETEEPAEAGPEDNLANEAEDGFEDELVFEDDELAEEPTPAAAPASDPAAAQAPAPAAEEAVEDRGPMLDEIIVTAQKRAEDIQDVPLSVTAIGGEAIKENNMNDLNTVATFAPNFEVLATPTFNFIYMRGLGSGYNRGFEQSVAIIIDEVFYGRPSYLSNGLLDLYAVEVLRGPQGTLFGKNSAAGALHLRTVTPEPDWETDSDLLVGDRELIRFRTAIGGPIPGLSDDFSFRIAALYESQEGDIENTTLNGRKERNLDNQTLRTKFRWQPSSTFDVLLAATFANVTQGGSGTQLTKVRPRHLAAMKVYDPRTEGDVFDDLTHQNDPGFVDRDTWDATLTVNWDVLDGYTLTNVTNMAVMDEDVLFDADFSPIPFLTLLNDEDYQQISQEFRVTSPPGTFEFVAGLFYFRSDIQATYDVVNYLELAEIGLLTGAVEGGVDPSFFDNELAGTLAATQSKARQDLEGTPVIETSTTDFDQLSNSYAAFGQATWHLTEQFQTTVGLRVTYEEKELSYDHRLINNRTGVEGEASVTNPLGSVAFPVIQTGNVQFQENRVREETDISPKISATYNWTDEVMTYVTIARGFKSGGFNAQAINPDQLEYEEEGSITYEGGLKSELLEGAARFNISAFHTEFSDLQITSFDGVSFVVTNAADATINGVEFEGMLITPWNLLFSMNGAWIDAKYDSFTTGPCGAETGETVCDLSGRPLTNAPEWNGTFNVAYDAQLFDWPVHLHAGLSAMYNSLTYFTVDLDPIDTREANTQLRGRVGVRGIDGNWHLMLFGTNLTDTEALAGNNDVPTFVGSHFGGRVPTTAFQLELRVLY